jgi:hypothetical protein
MTDKTNSTLVSDIYSVVKGQGGWDKATSKAFSKDLKSLTLSRFTKDQGERRYLSMSGLGASCKRKVWLRINEPSNALSPKGSDLIKFFVGDFFESLLLHLTKAAGHSVTGEQDELILEGVRGHRDAVINGVTVDVKTASPFSFRKFKEKKLSEDDPFGYLSQLSSYVAAAKDDPLVTDKEGGAFLVVNKVTGQLLYDYHKFDLSTKKEEVHKAKLMVAQDEPPPRLEPVPQYKTGKNLKLGIDCSNCSFRKKCWPEARSFVYSKGVEHLVHVEVEPNVAETYSD